MGQEVGSTSIAAALATNTGASLFSQPRSHAKVDFEKELTKMIEAHSEIKDNSPNVARMLTEGITVAQKAQGHGFLPDDARWRLLLNHIRNNRRFMLAIVLGHCTPTYLATAPEEEIQNRIAIMNGHSEKDFLAQLRRVFETPDPSNLNNIHRPMPHSARATEDAQVMRRAADKRTERRFRLPQWANNALHQPNSQNL
ncbi:hypothetical protein CFAM422_002206 [Trichoderma lentiforme]|uniref:Uncharacterized protein n=1 Tax=Trichoderma lentiforme TaxID=1567552 RepID=A0A9P4XL68_9HYPO|nr:hypothetical protein CFAM422_002206 [Trichoderma lentiforme]